MEEKHNLDYDLFRKCLTECPDNIDETWFMFLDDQDRGECILGYTPMLPTPWSQWTTDPKSREPKPNPRPYWVGTGCDVHNGADYATANELLHAPIYGGRSIAEAWEQVCVFNLGGVPLDIWFQLHLPAVEIDGYWSLGKRLS